MLLEEARIQATPGSDERKAAGYYAAYMDEAAIEARGLSGLSEPLKRIAAIEDRLALAAWLGGELRTDVDPLNMTDFQTDRLFGLRIAQDFNEPTRNTACLLQGGLGMPDRGYYVATTPAMLAMREKYTAHIAAVPKLAGRADAEAARVFDLETRIARVHASRVDSGDVQEANNPWSRADFDAKAPGLDWTTYFDAADLAHQPRFIVRQPRAIAGESALVASEPLDTRKDYLAYELVDHWSALLPKVFAAEHFSFHGTTLAGTPRIPDRWERAVASTDNAMGDAVGRLYVGRYFPPASKRRAEAMVADLKAAFARRIDDLEWMAPGTKAKARAKLETLIVGVGYPDRWRDYSGLQVSRNDALRNAMAAESYAHRRNLAKLGQRVERKESWMTRQTVSAPNLPIQNALNFPTAMLQPPFFDPDAPMANNFGAIGAVIGHEISHSFDDQGSQFDAAGRLENWWQPDDFAHFREASARLVAQCDAYKPLPDLSRSSVGA